MRRPVLGLTLVVLLSLCQPVQAMPLLESSSLSFIAWVTRWFDTTFGKAGPAQDPWGLPNQPVEAPELLPQVGGTQQ
jgi:hypothetical protein